MPSAPGTAPASAPSSGTRAGRRRTAVAVTAQRARPPYPDTPAGDSAQAVHVLGVKLPDHVVGQVDPQVKHSLHHLVGRGLVHADLLVATGVNARDISAGRQV